MRVLCVEDEVAIREDIAEYLRMRYYEVDEVGSGIEAMAQLRQQHYDLVLCDICMPHMDGYELLSEVRRENTFTMTPFVFLSALTERDGKIRAHETGCDAYLTKPIDFSLLDATVRAHIERQRARDFVSTRAIDASQQHMMSAIDDALAGPVADAGRILQHLREIVPVLTPDTLDDYLASMQTKINTHVLDLHTFYQTLQLQANHTERHHDVFLMEDLIQAAMEECVYHYPAMPLRYKAAPSEGVMVHGDKRMLQRSLAELFATVPNSFETKDVVRYTADDAEAVLTLVDDPQMLQAEEYVSIDETTNLAQLSEVTRHRLVALTHAIQVAQLHKGRLEVMIWPEERLAVRFVLPQLKH